MKILWSQIGGVLCLGLALWFVSFAPLHAATASSLGVRTVNEDSFFNYDFLNNLNTNANNVDWTLNMLYYNNANVANVKALYWANAGGAMWGRINDGGGWLWSSDTGTKSGVCDAAMQHMRLYANGNNRSNNISWGYYVLGSTHYDLDECWPPNTRYGWSETAEGVFAQHARDAHGLSVWEDWDNWGNAEPDRWEGNHFWQNNGLATAVNVP